MNAQLEHSCAVALGLSQGNRVRAVYQRFNDVFEKGLHESKWL